MKVTPQGRPKSKKPVTLSTEEPALDPVATPILGVEFRRIHLTGSGFGGASPPTVYFARAPGLAVAVATDGRSLDVTVPPGTSGATVSVAVVAPDGQGVARDGYFHYVPPPVISGVTSITSPKPSGFSAAR